MSLPARETDCLENVAAKLGVGGKTSGSVAEASSVIPSADGATTVPVKVSPPYRTVKV
jgi:hypothetical protein